MTPLTTKPSCIGTSQATGILCALLLVILLHVTFIDYLLSTGRGCPDPIMVGEAERQHSVMRRERKAAVKDRQDQREINLSVWTPAANVSSLYWLYSRCIKYGQGPGKDRGSLLRLPLLLLAGAAFGMPTKPSSPSGHVNPEQCVSQP